MKTFDKLLARDYIDNGTIRKISIQLLLQPQIRSMAPKRCISERSHLNTETYRSH